MATKIEFSGVQVGGEMARINSSKGWSPLWAANGRDRGTGPFNRLILRGAIVIDGTGTPPSGPAAGDHEIDCAGMYIPPGLVDSQAHLGSRRAIRDRKCAVVGRSGSLVVDHGGRQNIKKKT